MALLTAVLDACVLYSAPLRDLLMFLAIADLFRPRWTDRIHDEWIRNLLANRPDLKPPQLKRTRELMNSSVRDCLVTGYEDLVDSLELPDADDRHVLAAAIRSEAAVIVTYNISDFPSEYLQTFRVEARHPDDFICHLLDIAPGRACAAVKRHRQSLRNPPKTIDEFLDTLAKQRLAETVARLREYAELL